MARYPREEVTYKKLYKKIDLDRPLNISWPEVEEAREVCVVDETKFFVEPDPQYSLDCFDIEFCASNSLDQNHFAEKYTELESKFDKILKDRLRQIKPLDAAGLCDICGRERNEEDEKLLACNGCGVAVHPECYGAQHIERFWFCSSCTFSCWDPPCIVCSRKEGIFKRTEDHRWVHAVCASLHPRLSFINTEYNDPVDIGSLVSKGSIECHACGQESYFPVKCSYLGCKKRYHASCAAENLYCDLNNKIIYCQDHDFLTGSSFHKKSSLLEHRSSYKEMENDIFLRTPQKLAPRLTTDFQKVVSTDPGLLETKDTTDNRIIFEYWSDKRRAYGTSLTDAFRYINFMNNYY